MEEKDLNDLLQGIFDSLTDEQKEKAKACETVEELMDLAGKEGFELPDEALEEISGGGCGEKVPHGMQPSKGTYKRGRYW